MTLNSLKKKRDRLGSVVKNCLKGKSCSRRMCSLSEADRCGRMKICKVNGSRKQCARMASMGLRPGEEIDLICAEGGSNCLFKIQGGTISLDATTTKAIYVTPV